MKEGRVAVQIGVIGAGIMGADHARTLYRAVAGAELVAIVDADPARAAQVAADCGIAPRQGTAFDLIADSAVEAVLVASPDETHAELVLAAIAAGKPVLCEKPLAATIADCRRILAAEMAGGRRLVQVGYMRRFDPGYRAMKRSLDQGHLGPALFLHCVHRNAVAPGFMTSDMVITNSAVHEIDIARWLLGEDFAQASVITPRRPGGGERRPQFVVLESRSGVVVDVEAYVDAGYGYDVRAELVCEQGAVSLAPNLPVLQRHAGREGFAVPEDSAAAFCRRLPRPIAGLGERHPDRHSGRCQCLGRLCRDSDRGGLPCGLPERHQDRHRSRPRPDFYA